MKAVAAKGLETELDTRLFSSFGEPTDTLRLGPRTGQRGVRSLDVLA